VQALDDTGADSSRFNQLLDACIADTHQRKFSCGEERVRRYQKQDQKDPEQHECDHWVVILNETST
jgi:hypothetical protein